VAEGREDNGKGNAQENQVLRLLRLGGEAELFRTPDDEAYATVPVNDHLEDWPVRSRKFRQWLLRRYYSETESAPRAQAVHEALATFETRATFDGEVRPVFVRTAEWNNKIYIDLVNDKWEVIEVDDSSWRIVSRAPVRFRRARGMRPLVYPARGGCVEDLRRFVNLGSEEDWVLLVAWVMAALRPRGPYPVLALHGEHGSAKSTLAKVIRALLDPNTAGVRAEPRDVRDLMIAASNGLVVSLDNLSHIPAWLSDALCSLATGGSFGTRELYTDREEILFSAQRPAIINGIEELATRPDLLDRTVVLYLPSIPSDQRRSEAELWSDFDATLPRILGALLDALAVGLARLPNTKLPSHPRLADFALWSTAVEAGLGWPSGTFLRAYQRNLASANEVALEASVISAPLQGLVATGSFEGTATDLLHVLTDRVDEQVRKQRGWPRNSRALGGLLRRVAPNLRAIEIDVQFWRDSTARRERMISVRRVPSIAAESS